ncbi:YfhO family protein [Blastococcus capsensis]|uniref:YfhO family protein n=2 Tax=Bacillati TaxID=1783272 RepID=UPI00253FC7ED|nr:YfhO family protein [Blastococcus capsensis]MDK3256142.1 YfhO family protein [Blastococcus capsensis]
MSSAPPTRDIAAVDAHGHPRGPGLLAARGLTAVMVLTAVVFVAVTLGTSLIGRTSFYGGGLLLNNAPWSADHFEPVLPENIYVGDTVDVVIPSRAEMVERVRAGDLPGWSSLQGGGSELGSVPNFGLLAPTAVAWWVLPTDLAPGWERLTVLVVAAAGTAMFLRRVGLGRHASWLAGMVYASSGFMVAWTNWPHAAVAAMLPWLFWAVERSLQLRTLRSVVPVALAVAALLLGGFPAVTGWGFYVAGGYAVLRVLLHRRSETSWGPALAQLGRLSLGLVLGIGLAAFQLVVFLGQFLDLDTSYREGGFTHLLPARMALTILFPHTWGINGGPYFSETNPIESNAYFGAAAAVLCVLAVTARLGPHVVRGVRGYFASVAAVSFLLVYVQVPPFTDVIGRLPVFSNNPIGRLVAIMLLAGAVLAGFGAEALLRPHPLNQERRRRLVITTSVSGFGLVVLLLAIWIRRETGPWRDVPPLAAVPIESWLVVAMVCVAAVTALVLVGQWWPRLAAAGFVIVPALVAAQGLVAAAPAWAQVEADRFYPVTDMHGDVLDRVGHDRVLTSGVTMGGGATAYYGIRIVNGHVFFPEPFSDLIDRIDPTGRLSPTYWGPRSGLNLPLWQSPGLDRMAVRYVVADADTPIPGRDDPIRSGEVAAPLLRQPVEIPLPPGGIRGVTLEFPDGAAPASTGYLIAEVLNDEGDSLARSERLVLLPRPSPAISVPIAGEDLGGRGPLSLRLTWQGLDAAPAMDAAGVPAVTVIRPEDDGLRLVSDADGAVWERTTGLPRIRWASAMEVIADADARADAVAWETIAPDTVVLSSTGEEVAGRPAQLDVVEDSGDTVAVTVDAQGAGYLVLADSIQNDWSVTVDGREATIVAADHAFGAVHVAAGRHEVVFTYTPRGQSIGFGVSIASLVALLALALPTGHLGRGSRRGDAA